MLEELSSKDKVVGLKQVQRAVSAGRAGWVFLACDADPRLIRPLEGRCRERGVPVSGAHTMAQLGHGVRPGHGNAPFPAAALQRPDQPGIGVAGQKHPACPAGAYCPLHLFQAHHLVFG